MNRTGAIVAAAWLAGMAAVTATRLSAQTVDLPTVQIERGDRNYWYPVIRIGQDYTLKAGETAHEVTVIFGDATIEGRVDHNVVVVLGSAHLGPTAIIGESLVVVGGGVQAADGAKIDEDLFVYGGALDAPAGFGPRGAYVAIGSKALGSYLRGIVPWLTSGLLLGRPIVPGLPWVWTIALTFFIVNLLLNLVFDAPIKASVAVVRGAPLSTFMTGLLVMLLAGPVCLLLAVSVIGIAVVPFVLCAIVIAVVIGKIAFARWLGLGVVSQDDPDNRAQSFRSFLIGSAIMCVAYMIPVLGFATWAMAGVFGLGAATQAFFTAYRRENPKPPRKATVPVQPPSPVDPAAPAAAAFVSPADSISAAEAAPSADEPLLAAVAAPVEAAPPPPASDLILLPRATFQERLAAFTLDVILISIAVGVLDVDRQEARVFFLLALVYHVAFWTFKATTLGGIICQLRLVRVDGTRIHFPDALVRGLTGIFSLAVLGLGFLWILRDPDRQAWHDRVAGTYVVKVPRNWPV